MFRKFACVVALCAVIPLSGAYASGPTYSVHHASEPAVSPGSGRIYLYRESSLFGIAMEPAIKVDGMKVGDSSSGEYFYVDRPPGTYTVATTTEKDESVAVPLAAGQTVYVRFHVGMGFFGGHVIPEVVSDDQGTSEIKDCHFVGSDAPAAAPATPAAPPAATDAQTPPKN